MGANVHYAGMLKKLNLIQEPINNGAPANRLLIQVKTHTGTSTIDGTRSQTPECAVLGIQRSSDTTKV